MTKFRQPVRPGDKGTDVVAYKRALKRMHAQDSAALNLTRLAGDAFVHAVRALQHNRGQDVVDGIIGPATHALIAPHFSRADVLLYTAAKIRKPPLPSTAIAAAKRLLALHAQGRYRADNPGDLLDIEAAARGASVWSRGGYWVRIDARPLRLLVYLIDAKGWKIGTFAICSDHHNDGPHGHAGGLAVDISSINGVSVSSWRARALTLAVARAIRSAPGLRPWQLICGGYGYRRDPEISACSIPAADSFYTSAVMGEHCNHLHAGYR